MKPNRQTSLNVPTSRVKQPALRILYLEDDPSDVLLLRRVLAKMDLQAEICPVTDSGEYKSAVEHKGYDLLLSDTGLPGFTGLQALVAPRNTTPRPNRSPLELRL